MPLLQRPSWFKRSETNFHPQTSFATSSNQTVLFLQLCFYLFLHHTRRTVLTRQYCHTERDVISWWRWWGLRRSHNLNIFISVLDPNLKKNSLLYFSFLITLWWHFWLIGIIRGSHNCHIACLFGGIQVHRNEMLHQCWITPKTLYNRLTHYFLPNLCYCKRLSSMVTVSQILPEFVFYSATLTSKQFASQNFCGITSKAWIREILFHFCISPYVHCKFCSHTRYIFYHRVTHRLSIICIFQ